MIYKLEWIVWGLFLFLTLLAITTWLYKRGKFKSGKYYNTEDVITLYAIPTITLAESIPLVVFLFIPLSKLHLIWIWPLVYWIILCSFARRQIRLDKKQATDGEVTSKTP